MSLNAKKEAYRLDAERVVKRLKKSELASYIARITEARDETEEGLRRSEAKLHAENQALKSQLKNLKTIENVVALVISTRSGHRLAGSEQMTMLFDERTANAPANATTSMLEVLENIIDNCEEIVEEVGGGHGAPSYFELECALDGALGDRAELLKRLGLTDYEWSAQGGACETELLP